MPKLDDMDLKILSVLQSQGRITNAALAEAVNLSPSPCLQRTKRLEAEGIIKSYGARLDLERISDTLTVFTEITLEEQRIDNLRAFETAIRAFPEVIECHLISGGYDYLLKFLCRSVADYQLSIEKIVGGDLGVAKYFSYLVIKSPIPTRDRDITDFLHPGNRNL